MIALRYLRARRKETFISVIAGFSFVGIMLGVATLIVVMAVMNGFRAELLDKILGINGHLVLQAIDRPLDDFNTVQQRVAEVDGVEIVVPFVEGQALASGANASNGVIVRGVTEDDLRALPSLSQSIRSGTLDGFGGIEGLPAETIVIGSRLASTLGVTVGDSV
ncbi:MAG: ABC transporter permease, partial [Pseudomonadota bacterium]